jgi:hypothetical protein
MQLSIPRASAALMRLVAVLLFVIGFASSQTTAPLCASFNDGPTTGLVPIDFCSTHVSFWFTAPSTFTVTEFEVFGTVASSCILGTINVQGASSSGCGHSSWEPEPGWWKMVVAPIVLTAGAPCAITLQPFSTVPANTPMTLYANPSGTTAFPVGRTCYGAPACATGSPCLLPPSNDKLLLRLRGPACTGGTPAVTINSGTGCGTPAPSLFINEDPSIGNLGMEVWVFNNGIPGPYALFVAEGFATSGTSVEPGHPCKTYLNPASFASLAMLGHEPLQVHQATPGGFAFLVSIPALPELVGLIVTFQVAATGQGGVPLNSAPSVLLRVTNAVSIQIGG